MQVGAELAVHRLPFHRRDHFVADDEAADVAAARFLDKLLHHDVGIQSHKRLDDAFGGVVGFRQNHADALCALQ